MTSATKDAIQQATVTAGLKVNVKQEADLSTFVAPLMQTIGYDIEGDPPVCKQRDVTLRSELEQVKNLVEVYLRRHFITRAEHSVKVRHLLLLSKMNIDLHEGMNTLVGQGGELYRKHTYTAPAPGTGRSGQRMAGRMQQARVG